MKRKKEVADLQEFWMIQVQGKAFVPCKEIPTRIKGPSISPEPSLGATLSPFPEP